MSDHDAPLEEVRTQAIRLIEAAESHGILTPVNAFEHRTFVLEAREAHAIRRLVDGLRVPADLVPIAPHDMTLEVPAELLDDEEPDPPLTTMRLSATFSSEERKGEWSVPDVLEIESVLGSIELDLRGALVSSDVLEIDYSVILGSIKIIVPPGVEVSTRNETWLGSFEHKAMRGAEPVGRGFLLRLRGTSWLGSVEVVEKEMPGDKGALKAVGRWLLGR